MIKHTVLNAIKVSKKTNKIKIMLITIQQVYEIIKVTKLPPRDLKYYYDIESLVTIIKNKLNLK